MALIKCPECGKQVSNKAHTCPNCGCPIQNSIVQTNTISKIPNKRKKNSSGCLVIILILCLFSGFVALTAENSNTTSIISKSIDVTDKQSERITTILEKCGIETIKSIKHDTLLDNAHFKGETGYRITINDDVDNIILYLKSNKKVYSIRYADNNLYAKGKVVSTIQDYTFTSRETSELMINCKNQVKEILTSPSTAKFPNILDWGFAKNKNIVTVQSYVDAQNSFGATVRSEFQFVINTDTNTIQSFIFDGQELISK